MDLKSNELFAAIVATVGATIERRLTVAEIASRLETSADVTAHCIAFHRYVRSHAENGTQEALLACPMPADFAVPDPDDLIDEGALGLAALPPVPR